MDSVDSELREQLEHREVLQSIQSILITKPGRDFIKYLFKSFEVGELPAVGIEGSFLMDRLGFLRAGNSVFKIVAEANAEQAGQIIAQIEKEKHAYEINP